MKNLEQEIRAFLESPPPRRWERTTPEVKRALLGQSWWALYVVDVLCVSFFLLLPLWNAWGRTSEMIGVGIVGGFCAVLVSLLMRKIRSNSWTPVTHGRLYKARLLQLKELPNPRPNSPFRAFVLQLEVHTEVRTLRMSAHLVNPVLDGLTTETSLAVLFKQGASKSGRLLWKNALVPLFLMPEEVS